MAKTVVGLYENGDTAERVVSELVDAGFARDNISITARAPEGAEAGHAGDTGDTKAGTGAATGAGVGAAVGGVGGLLAGLGVLAIPGIGPIVAAGPLVAALAGAGVGAAAGGLVGGLVGLGISEDHAGAYAEGVRRGGYLVIVDAADEDADRAAQILDRYDPVDIEQRATEWRQSGWTDTTGATAGTGQAFAGRAHGTSEGEHAIPVVEEQLQVGKREVERGGVRVRSYVVERPVEAEVRLRDESVHVERRQVDRPVTADEDAFRERTIEMRETDEVAVVGKEQRVVEEVVVGKDVSERTERVAETVRRTEVEVDDRVEKPANVRR